MAFTPSSGSRAPEHCASAPVKKPRSSAHTANVVHSRQPLTARQQEVLSAIRSFIAAKGYPPTFREIGDALGIGSKHGVNDHLKALVKKGWIERDLGTARGIRVVP